MSEIFERQARLLHRDSQHPRAEHGIGRQTQGFAHDGRPAVGADDACGGQGPFRTVQGIGDTFVFDCGYPCVWNEIDISPVLDTFAQLRDEQRVIARQTHRPAHIREYDRFGAVFRKYHESLAHGGTRQGVEFYPDVAQYLDSRRMQPFARQSLGRLGIRFEQGHPGAFPRMSERTQAAHRTRADNGDGVLPRSGAAHRKTLGSERRR